MEKKSRTKRDGSPPRKERRDSVKARGQSSGRSIKKDTSTTAVSPSPSRSVLGIPLNNETARQAIILSEIIGKPVSKRRTQR